MQKMQTQFYVKDNNSFNDDHIQKTVFSCIERCLACHNLVKITKYKLDPLEAKILQGKNLKYPMQSYGFFYSALCRFVRNMHTKNGIN